LNHNAQQKKNPIILRVVDIYSNQDKDNANESEESSESKSKGAYPCDWDFLMIRRALNNQPNPP